MFFLCFRTLSTQQGGYVRYKSLLLLLGGTNGLLITAALIPSRLHLCMVFLLSDALIAR